MKVLEFWAPWCQPCKISKAAFDRLDKEGRLNIEVQMVNIDEDQALATIYSVKTIPTMILLADDGSEVARKSGSVTPTELINFLCSIDTMKF